MNLSQSIKRWVRQRFRDMGLELSWYPVPRLFSSIRPDVVLDIGANVGQFADEIRRAGFRGRIVSFEPLSSAHRQLLERCRRDRGWCVAPRMAIGSTDEETTIHVAGNSFSSSLLPMEALHEQVAPGSRYIAKERVTVRRLDSVFDSFVKDGESVLLKMDVQGFERQVLEGARESMPRIGAIQLEAALAPLYEGEATLLELVRLVVDRGYELWSITPGLIDHRSGRLLQADCVFVKPAKGDVGLD